MNEILITQEPVAPIEIDAVAARVLTVTSPPEVYVPYIGANGRWWVAGIDSGITARGEPGKDVDHATVAALAADTQAAQTAAAQAQAEAVSAAEAAAAAAATAGQAQTAATHAADAAAKAAESAAEAATATDAAAANTDAAAKAAAAAGQAAETAARRAAEAQAAAETTAAAVAAMPVTVSGTAPCLKTGSFAFTRIYFPRPFAALPHVVPGVMDFASSWRVAAVVGLTVEYVDLITNYWHAANTFTYIAVGKLAE